MGLLFTLFLGVGLLSVTTSLLLRRLHLKEITIGCSCPQRKCVSVRAQVLPAPFV